MKLSSYGKTDIGRLRSNNEDSLHLDESRGIFIVADGMGGHAAGEIASAMAITAVRERLEDYIDQQADPATLSMVLTEALTEANRAIAQAACDNPAWSGMGTTLTILMMQNGTATLAHVGDSRLYQYRAKQLQQLSDDHSLIADQIRRGVLTSLDAHKSDLRNILLQAVGVSEKLDICLKNFPVEAEDRFLLCSDGLTDMLTLQKIAATLMEFDQPKECCEQLIAEALEAGGKDNVTALLVKVEIP